MCRFDSYKLPNFIPYVMPISGEMINDSGKKDVCDVTYKLFESLPTSLD